MYFFRDYLLLLYYTDIDITKKKKKEKSRFQNKLNLIIYSFFFSLVS